MIGNHLSTSENVYDRLFDKFFDNDNADHIDDEYDTPSNDDDIDNVS